jgi:hypothetical protein
MGMHELGLRKAVLREINKYKMMEDEQAAAKLKKLDEPIEVCLVAHRYTV